MGIIAADLFITLDGVYQAPGGRDEDPTDGFAFGGWQAPFGDAAIGASIMSSIQRTDALLLGRRTYDIFSSFWPFQPASDPIAAKFAAIPKYVVSRTLNDPSWAGTTVLRDAAAVGALRDEFDEVHTWGSGELLRGLLAEGSPGSPEPVDVSHRSRHRQAALRHRHRAKDLPSGQACAGIRCRGPRPRAGARRRCADGRDGGRPGVARRRKLAASRGQQRNQPASRASYRRAHARARSDQVRPAAPARGRGR